MKKKSSRSRRVVRFALFLISCVAVIVMMRHALAGLAADGVLHHLFSKEKGSVVVYSSARWDGSVISITGLEIDNSKERLQIERVELILGLRPHLWVIHPSYLIKSHQTDEAQNSEHSLALLRLLKIDVVEGRCATENQVAGQEGDRFYFSVESQEENELGLRLKCYEQLDQPDQPFAKAALAWQGDQLDVDIEATTAATRELIFLLRLVGANGWEHLQASKGSWDLELKCALNKRGKLLKLHGEMSAAGIVLESPSGGWQFEAEELKLTLASDEKESKKAWYRTLDVEAAIGGGAFHLYDEQKEYRFNDLAGQFSWQKASDPKFHLEGKLIIGDGSEKVLAFGNGQFEEAGGFCLKSQVRLGEKEKALAAVSITVATEEEVDFVIEADVQQMELPFFKRLSDTFGWTSPSLFSVMEGNAAGACRIIIHHGDIMRIEVKPSTITRAALKNEEMFQTNSLSMLIDGRWDYSKKAGWQIRRLKGSILSGDIDLLGFKQMPLKNISGEFLLQESEIEQSSLKAFAQEIPIEVVLSGNWERPSYQIYTSTTWTPFTKMLSFLELPIEGSYLGEETVECTFELKAFPENYSASFQLCAGSEGKLECRCDIIEGALKSGVMNASRFPLAPIFSIFTKEFDGKGNVDLEGRFDSQGGEALFTLEEMEVQTKDWSLDMLVTSTGQLKWGPNIENIQLQLPLRTARCTFKNIDLSLEKLSTLFTATSKEILLKDLETLCCGVQFKGEVGIHERGVSIVSHEIQGTLMDLSRLLKSDPKLPRLPSGIQGHFRCKERDFRLDLPSRALALHVSMDQIFLPLGYLGALDHAATELFYDSKDNTIGLKNLHGDLRLKNGKSLQFEVQPFTLCKQEKEMAGVIEASVKLGEEKLVHCLGQLKITDQESNFELLTSKSLLLGGPLDKGGVRIRKDGIGCRLSGRYKLEGLSPLMDLLSAADILKFKELPRSIQGELAYNIAWDSKSNRLEAVLKSKEIAIEGSAYKNVALRIIKDPKKLSLDELVWDNFRAHAEFLLDRSSDYPFSYMMIGSSWNSSGEGNIFPSQYKIDFMPKLELVFKDGESLVLKPKSKCSIDFSKDQQISLLSCKWEESKTHSTIEIAKTSWNRFEKKLDLDGIAFRVAGALFKKWGQDIKLPSGWLAGTARFTKGAAGIEAVGVLEDGDYGWLKQSFNLKSIQWRLLPKTFLLGSKMEFGEIQTLGTFQFDFEEKLALLKLQQQGENGSLNMLVRMHEKSTPIIERFSGEFSGIRADMKNVVKDRTVLRGKLDVNFKEFSRLIPVKKRKSWQRLKAGKGYSFEGDIAFNSLDVWQADGNFLGRDFVLFDTELSEASGRLQLSPKKLLIKELQLRDGTFHLSVPYLGFEETLEKSWMLSCPLIQVKDLQPSRLRKIEEQEKTLKPFVIRNLTMTEVRGDLDRPESFSGNCALQFTNAGKKESNFFDIPLNILKDLGLEPSLLVPIQGELMGHLYGGKLLFTELKGSYSEGRRTQFALSDRGDGSYIDFDGKLHIDLMMRQAVLLKIVESLTLGIRGNLEKPRYMLLP